MSYLGVIEELIAGTWRDPSTGKTYGIPIDAVVMDATLEGREADLVHARHGNKRFMVVHDGNTKRVLGERVLKALQAAGEADEYFWPDPHCTDEEVRALSEATRDADVLIAVGSGSISDSVKYATFLDGREYSVFCTSPMTAYTTPTASVAFGGFKKSLTCHAAKGVFFDLDVVANAPRRLITAAFADVICRTTAQVDWLLSHLLLGTDYSEVAYTLLAEDEAKLVEEAAHILDRTPAAVAELTRVSAIMGSATAFTGTTHVGSMAEHMISHSIDMFAPTHNPGGHPGTSHGDQVGVATLSISRLHNEILCADGPPEVGPTAIPRSRIEATYDGFAASMVEATRDKALDEGKANALNRRLAADWDDIRRTLGAVMRPYEEVHAAMTAAGCKMSAEDLGLSQDFYRQCVRDARFIRDRFSMLDIADDAGRLEPFVATIK